MDNALFTGVLVRLTAEQPETDSKILAEWSRDTEYQRLLEVHPVRPHTAAFFKKRFESAQTPTFFAFAMRRRTDDALLGTIMLMHVNYTHGDGMVGIGIGKREEWGKGYGSDAMNVILRFAFQELNLHRVSLLTLGSNTRAIRSYEKCGFVHEGRMRGAEHRGGARDDVIVMGIVRDEWLARQDNTT
jgi:RimJ/RimL family protein N-acetyltransferase